MQHDKLSRGKVESSPRWWNTEDLNTHIEDDLRGKDRAMTHYLSGRGRRQCWCCPRVGTLQRVHVPSNLKDFVGDDKNHLLCERCVKLLEQAKQSQQLTVHPSFQQRMDTLLPLKVQE